MHPTMLASGGLPPSVVALAHPINTDVHPLVPTGWRWAVQIGDSDYADMSGCVGAGHAETEGEASVRAEEVGAAVVQALRRYGVPVRYAYVRLGYDPVPAEADDIPLGVWHGEQEQEQP